MPAEVALGFLFFMLGASLSSFTHTLAVRLKNGQGCLGRSRCEQCSRQIPWYYLAPVFGFFFTGGKCRNCSYKIPADYPIVELIGGAMAFVFFLRLGLTPSFYFSLLVFQLFFFIGIYDFYTKYILSFSVIVLFAVQTVYILFWNAQLLFDSFLAMIIGAGAFHFLSFFYTAIRGKIGLGEGDATLFGMIGFCFGRDFLLPVVLLSSILGLLVAVPMLLLGKSRYDQPVPYGPALVAGTYLHWLYPDWFAFVFSG